MHLIRYQLPAHVRVTFTHDGAVFLDLERNRYFGLAAAPTQALRALLEWREVGDYAALTTLLLGGGLLEVATAAISVPVPYHPARLGIGQLDSVASAALSPRKFAQAYRWARHAVEQRTLWSVVQELASAAATSSEAPTDTTLARAAALTHSFHRLRPYAFTARDRCLLHALALVRYLLLHGVRATWLMGIHTQPWQAHSWVQLGNVVLDTTPEHVLEFSPLLIV